MTPSVHPPQNTKQADFATIYAMFQQKQLDTRARHLIWELKQIGKLQGVVYKVVKLED